MPEKSVEAGQQDPLVVAQKKKAELDAEKLKTKVQPARTLVHEIDALKKLVQDASTPNGRVLLLAVMMDSGPYIEQEESRLRSRQAVLEGLSESGFVPKDSEHIGFINWIQDTGEHNETLIPWEECKADNNPEHVYPRGTQEAFVLWLPSASFAAHPLERFAALIDRLAFELLDQGFIYLGLAVARHQGAANAVMVASRGLRRHQRHVRSRAPTGRTLIGWPSR